MAPEVGVIGATYASDIFSLGVTAIHLLIDPKNVADPTVSINMHYNIFRYLIFIPSANVINETFVLEQNDRL